jgi:hypothetical protein
MIFACIKELFFGHSFPPVKSQRIIETVKKPQTITIKVVAEIRSIGFI